MYCSTSPTAARIGSVSDASRPFMSYTTAAIGCAMPVRVVHPEPGGAMLVGSGEGDATAISQAHRRSSCQQLPP
jgi:hypothetical protein